MTAFYYWNTDLEFVNTVYFPSIHFTENTAPLTPKDA